MERRGRALKGAGYLLDDLAALAGCGYLSNLKYQEAWGCSLYRALSSLESGNYAVSEWNEAVQYLSGVPDRFQSAEEARGFLLRILKEGAGEKILHTDTTA